MPAVASSEQTLALLTRFENGFNKRDVDALMADMTEDTVFEHIAPEGQGLGRHEGQAAVRAVWEGMEAHFPKFDLKVIDIFATADRGACQWTMTWRLPDGGTGHARGADIFRIRDGKIAEKLSYIT